MLYFLIILAMAPVFADETLETIEISHQGTSNTLVDFVPSVTTLKNNELRKRREITLGDTLKNEPGVQSSSFGPNASRPVIRGLDGDRIRVLQNGLGVLDASAQSVDHAVPLDTLVIDSIEVVRGPMSMLYGSSAVGGVVNVNTTRIHSAFDPGSISEVQVQGDSSQNAVSTSAKIDYGVKNWMFHIDGGYRNANDLRIPGKQKSSHYDAPPGEFTSKNKLPNSSSVQKTAAVGASHIFSKGYVGMSYYFFDNMYGTVAEESVDIKMKQNRVELHGEYRFDGNVFKSVRLKTAQSDYSHKEFEDGSVGTTFSNEGNETRLEFMTTLGSVKGISGIQTQQFNFKAVGDEAYLPPTRNQAVSGFTLQELTQGSSTYSVGARIENAHIHNQESGGKNKNFNGLGGSLGYRYKLNEGSTALSSFSYTERLPNFQELFANGFHVASGTFEQGKDDLNKEKAYAVDLGIKHKSSELEASFSIYSQLFKDYTSLFLTNTPSSEPGVDISEYRQVDAVFYGFEFDSKVRISQGPFQVVTKADLVRAKDKDSGKNLPRISPPRASVGLEWSKDRVALDIEAQYNFEQTKTAPLEPRTDSFTLLNAGVTYDLVKSRGKYSFFGRVKNILNQEARVHTSTLKDIAPMAGRNVVAGVQYSF